jgi:2,4-dienoyl-CoA reductase [(3E)-enoyl-CoA-producing], peroxisomal
VCQDTSTSTSSNAWTDECTDHIPANRVLFITGGAGSIGSTQTRAVVHLGANACIIGRSVEKAEKAAKEIAQVRPGAKVLGIGNVDVRNVGTLSPAYPPAHPACKPPLTSPDTLV